MSGLAYLTQSAEDAANDRASAYPEDEAGWASRYQFLWDAFLGKDYGAAVQKLWHLYRALDDSNCEIDSTYRVYRDFTFLVKTYAASVAGVHPGPILELDRGAPASLLTPGEAIWRRSGTKANVGTHARMSAALGHGGWEVVRMNRAKPYDTRLVWRDAREFRIYYDKTKTMVDKVVVECGYIEESELKALDGLTDSPAIHTYRRVLTKDLIEVYRDEQPVAEEGGPHGLGVVPFAHAVWEPWTEPEHGLPAGHPIDRALAMMDSVLCMARAVGNRSAGPVGVLTGAKLGTNNIGWVGRVLSGLPADANFKYVEPNLSAVKAMLETIAQLRAHITETEPAYVFSDSTAQESGEAKGYRAANYETACYDLRTRFYGALTRATGMAAAADDGRTVDEGEPGFTVDLPPILPRNVASEVKTYVEIRADLTRVDRVRQLQRLGFVPAEEDPAKYALTIDEETASRAGGFFGDDPGGSPAPKAPAGTKPG